MSKFFRMDSPLWNFFNWLADLVILNVCFVIGSIPIVTIGASWTALYYTMIKKKCNQADSITRTFFYAFRENIKQATIMWVIDLLLLGLILLDLVLVGALPGELRGVLHMAVFIVGLVFVLTIMYSFPLLAQFDNSIVNMYKNAFVMCIRHIGYTILLAIITLAPVLVFFTDARTFPAILMLYLVIGFALSAFINTGLYQKIFQKYMPKESPHGFA